MEFRILKGNIIDARVDAIVLPANTKLKEGSGASEAIFKAAGRENLTKACKNRGYCEVGSAVATFGFDLSANCIIHAVVPKWKGGKHKEYETLCLTYFSALQLADTMGCKSIAFPLLASGNNGFDMELALEIALESIDSFKAQKLEEVILVVYGNTVAEMIRGKGMEVGVLPSNLEKDKMIYKRTKEEEEQKKELKKYWEEQIKIGLEILKKPETKVILEKCVDTAIKMVCKRNQFAGEILIGVKDIIKKGEN